MQEPKSQNIFPGTFFIWVGRHIAAREEGVRDTVLAMVAGLEIGMVLFSAGALESARSRSSSFFFWPAAVDCRPRSAFYGRSRVGRRADFMAREDCGKDAPLALAAAGFGTTRLWLLYSYECRPVSWRLPVGRSG